MVDEFDHLQFDVRFAISHDTYIPTFRSPRKQSAIRPNTLHEKSPSGCDSTGSSSASLGLNLDPDFRCRGRRTDCL